MAYLRLNDAPSTFGLTLVSYFADENLESVGVNCRSLLVLILVVVKGLKVLSMSLRLVEFVSQDSYIFLVPGSLKATTFLLLGKLDSLLSGVSKESRICMDLCCACCLAGES